MKQTVGYVIVKEDLDDVLDAFRQVANHYELEEIYIDEDGFATVNITASKHVHNILSGIYMDNPRWERAYEDALEDAAGYDEEEEENDHE